jgi:signal transduction histidine kinase
MLAAIAVVTGLAWWDEQREAGAALQDLQSEQAILAESIAGALRVDRAPVADALSTARPKGADSNALSTARPKGADSNALRDWLDVHPRLGRPGELVLLLAAPNETSLHAADGTIVDCPPLRDAFDRGLTTLRLTRPEAAQVGLPARTAMAGLAHVDAGDLSHWGVVVVASAARERDREKRAEWRLILGVLVASGLVLAFGGAALRRQRKELLLERELAVAEIQRVRDEELLHAERVATMGTFAMGIAHEVSTPLGVIVGRAEQLLAKVRDDERATRSAQAILTQADRIQLIVRRFLDMARGGPPSLERLDPSGVVRAAVEAVEHRFAKAAVTLKADVPVALPAIQCDRDLLEQAIVNLLLNACEACRADGRVEIAARADDEHVAFVVTDDGAGISPENARRATEPFFTTKPRATEGRMRTQAPTSTGMGLAIAAEIVKSHRGELTIAPNVDRGTRARIAIPIAGGSRG